MKLSLITFTLLLSVVQSGLVRRDDSDNVNVDDLNNLTNLLSDSDDTLNDIAQDADEVPGLSDAVGDLQSSVDTVAKQVPEAADSIYDPCEDDDPNPHPVPHSPDEFDENGNLIACLQKRSLVKRDLVTDVVASLKPLLAKFDTVIDLVNKGGGDLLSDRLIQNTARLSQNRADISDWYDRATDKINHHTVPVESTPTEPAPTKPIIPVVPIFPPPGGNGNNNGNDNKGGINGNGNGNGGGTNNGNNNGNGNLGGVNGNGNGNGNGKHNGQGNGNGNGVGYVPWPPGVGRIPYSPWAHGHRY